MSSRGSENPLLSKWTTTGLAGSLQSSTLLSGSVGQDTRKRKPDSKKSDVCEKKSRDSLLSGLTGNTLLGSTGSKSTMLSRGNLGFSLTSSLLSKPSTDSDDQKRPFSQLSNSTTSSFSSTLLKTGLTLTGNTSSTTRSTGSCFLSHGNSSLATGSSLAATGSLAIGSALTKGSTLMSRQGLQSTNLGLTSVKLESSSHLGLSTGISSTLLCSVSTGSAKSGGRKIKTGGKKKEKSRKKIKLGKYEAPTPEYNLTNEVPAVKEISMPKFTPPDLDRTLMAGAKLHDVNGMKFALVNAVSGSLICQPDFKSGADPTRVTLVTMSEKVICYDPEFVLKLALYSRKQLNIRTTSNFLLALASHIPACRPYLKRYFNVSIALPSDWIEVAEIYSAFPEKTLPLGSLPSALRRAMVNKFPDFDKYQLAKYNKESSGKKKRKKERLQKEQSGEATRGGGRGRGRGASRGSRGGRGASRGARGGTQSAPAGKPRKRSMLDSDTSSSESDSESDSDSDEEYEKYKKDIVYDDGESPEQLQKMSFTLKQLIRKLHITEPVEHVMCLIGKKYPTTLEEFYRCRLPGTFDEERAGKRMKLPVPETWETQVSLKGNKAATWQELLDHKKLPFMAMLRNLRNLIKAGISSKHHTGIIRRLTDDRQVINSKQFPFRFFSAYEVLEQLQKDYETSQAAIIAEAEEMAAGGGQPKHTKAKKEKLTADNWWAIKKQRKKEKDKKPKETPFDSGIINRYRKALDTAVKIATVYNVAPIRGRTLILCNVSSAMDAPCTAARGLGKPRTMREVCILLGLMCKYSCEDSTMIIFDSDLSRYISVKPKTGTILENMRLVLETDVTEGRLGNFNEGLPMEILYDGLRDRIQIDNLLLMTVSGSEVGQRQLVNSFMEMYRRIVNPDLLYVNVGFAGKSSGFAKDIKPEHENNIYISGFSDQILRFIAERGDGGQLRHVEKIDEAFNLKPLPTPPGEKLAPPRVDPETPLQMVSYTPRWRTARVFISSTFRDMHGERDLLTRFVFPELRALGKQHFINVHEVDLRWGVTEEETRNSKTLELCLSEVQRCQFFLGILGERYGWVPDEYIVPDTPEFAWVREYKPGASVTELEMQAGALGLHPKTDRRDVAFFFIRDNGFQCNIPKELCEEFLESTEKNRLAMEHLKTRIRSSGLEVFDGYPCDWAGIVDGKAMVARLDQFGARALNNLWNGIQKMFPDEAIMLDEHSHVNSLHESYVQQQQALFVGRTKLVKDCLKLLREMKSGVISLPGKPGTGKTALLANIMQEYKTSKHCDSGLTILNHFVGAAPGSTNILATLRRLCHELNARFSLQMEVPEDFKNTVVKFGEMLTEAGTYTGTPLVLFLDGFDNMDPAHLPHNLDWLMEKMPKNVVVVMTCQWEGKFHKSLRQHGARELVVEALDMWDKAEVVRSHLGAHRKTLNESPFNNQMKLLVSKKEASIPLYLSLACEELRVFGVFEKITSKLKSLPHTVPLLLQEVLSRLEGDLGKEIVSSALCLLICARDGLTLGELHDLLSLQALLGSDKPKVKDIYNMQPGPEQQLPAARMAFLQRALQGFLHSGPDSSGSLCLAHIDIETAVKTRYLKGAVAMETEQFLHRLMAGYFFSQADTQRDGTWKGKSARAYQELPFHLARSGSYQDLEEVLCNVQFLYSKCMLGLSTGLIEDFQPLDVTSKTQEREQAKFFEKQRVKDYKSFVSRNLHVLSSYPALTWQQAYNERAESAVTKEVLTNLKSSDTSADNNSIMEWISKPETDDPCYLSIPGLPQAMTCVAISSNNKHFACGGLDCLVHLYDIHTGQEVKSFRGHADTITDICFIGSTKLCSVSKDATVSIWDVVDGHRLLTPKGHQRRVNSCTSDRSGKILATGAWDSTIKIWGTGKGDMMCEFKTGSPVNCVSFHPEGQKLVSGQWDTTIKIWDVFHKTKIAVLRGHKSSVRDVAYSPTGRHIASAALDGDVKLWAAEKGAQIGNIEGHALPINKLTFSPTGQQLITVSDDNKVKVWSGNLGKPVGDIMAEDQDQAVSVAISPDRKSVAIGYHSGKIEIHDVQGGSKVCSRQVHTASVLCLKYITPLYLLSGSDDKTATILSSSKLQQLCKIEGHTKGIMGMDICWDMFALSSEDCTVSLYENPFKYGGNSKPSTIPRCATLGTHTGPVTSCTFNKETKATRMATASRDMSVRIWDILDVCLSDSPTPLHIIHQCHNDWVTDCKWSNTGDVIITAANDFNIKVWDVSKIGNSPGETQKDSTSINVCKEKFCLTGHTSAINHIAYSYGCVVSTCADGSVKVWSHKGIEITTLYGHMQRANGCDISVKLVEGEAEESTDDWTAEETEEKSMLQPKIENVLVATCGDDGLVKLWHPLQANELSCLTGHSDKVLSVDTSSQGQLCTTSLDRSVRLWSYDTTSSPLIGCHDAPVTFVTADNYILSGSRDGVIKIWDRLADSYDYKCVTSAQAHEKAVTCGCWLDLQMFVTGSDDHTVCLWRIADSSPISLKQGAKFKADSPLICMDSNKSLDNPCFFTIEWSGALKVWNKKGLVISVHTGYGPTCMLMKVRYNDDNKTLLVSTMFKAVLEFSVNLKSGSSKKQAAEEMKLKKTHSIPNVANPSSNPWILDVTADPRGFITGDTEGQIAFTKVLGERMRARKVHSDAVTNVLYEEGHGLVFTGSKDRTIKVWTAESNFTQVGHFFCLSPVTAMCLLGPYKHCHHVPLAYGDELGNVNMLLWRTSIK
ncbi:telomerase protein component 1-like [Mya arenaria]|uniref:telomerase protein component 1-like n=1 Tax=Mya arenaria TaxID=6604 RepID=UPI0022E45B75|nr:telomerase protein component 1-like [Mya arenaria]